MPTATCSNASVTELETAQSASVESAPHSQPVLRVERDGVAFTLLGTAHVSRASVAAVEALLAAESFDTVAVELCAPRADAIRNPERIREMDLFEVVRSGRVPVVAAGLALGAYQRRLARRFGIEPGAEMKAALDGAGARGLGTWLIDRDVGTTMRRVRAALGSFWERTKLTAGLLGSLLDDTEVDEAEIERLKQGDVLEDMFGEFARQSPALYEALIAERDRYMAAKLREFAARDRPRRVLAVVGAGHLEGLARELRDAREDPLAIAAPLEQQPPPSRFGAWFSIAIMVFLLGGFAWAFAMGVDVGVEVLWAWIVLTAFLGAVGAAVAGAHPFSVLGAAAASPLTPLHPLLASGMVSAAIELWARKPRVGDFEALRDDLASLKGWWRNRVSRVFLVFFFTNLGTSVGAWIGGFQLVKRLSSLL